MSVLGKLSHSLSPDSGKHTVSLALADPASLVVASVHISEPVTPDKTPCAKIIEARDPGIQGVFLQDRSNHLSSKHIDKIVLMVIIGRVNGTRGSASVGKLMAKLPDSKQPERIPGSFLLFEVLDVTSSLSKLPNLFEKVCLYYLAQYKEAASKGMYRGKSMPFDKFAYMQKVDAEYAIEPLPKGLATHVIARKDGVPMSYIDWLFLQKKLFFSCDKPPVAPDPKKPDHYVVTRAAPLAE